ncbi:hypothetical protein [Rickettsia endosymbiont of Urophora cardui]|uniref:hypothetical protein n=1 Tax=Rickettsia endosymbiont of Urophora cardui TaxID=3066265 RepID=UPI00313A8FAB
MKENPDYNIVLSQESLEKIISYKNDIISLSIEPGGYLKKSIDKVIQTGTSLEEISNEQFIELLLSTKKPKIFAESEILCNGTDWNRKELQILGDINITMPVQVYDNGAWSPSDNNFLKHITPLNAELLFTPGALLQGNITGNIIKGHMVPGVTPDFEEVVDGNRLNQDKYTKLVNRRLTPILTHANESAKKNGISAIITLPGIGCGTFAGRFIANAERFLP